MISGGSSWSNNGDVLIEPDITRDGQVRLSYVIGESNRYRGRVKSLAPELLKVCLDKADKTVSCTMPMSEDLTDVSIITECGKAEWVKVSARNMSAETLL